MTDPVTLNSILLAGGYMMADATVKEATKDAYQKVKAALRSIFGRRAEQAAEKLESEATREEGKAELATLIPDIRSDEATELAPVVEAFLAAVREDASARAVTHSRVGLDLDVAGNVLLQDIQGAREIAVKAKAQGDFTLTGVRMDRGSDQGN